MGHLQCIVSSVTRFYFIWIIIHLSDSDERYFYEFESIKFCINMRLFSCLTINRYRFVCLLSVIDCWFIYSFLAMKIVTMAMPKILVAFYEKERKTQVNYVRSQRLILRNILLLSKKFRDTREWRIERELNVETVLYTCERLWHF